MTVEQLSFPSARSSDPATSHQAARTNRAGRTLLADRLLAVFRENPALMWTDDELAQAMPQEHAPSLVKRRGELVAASWICDAGFTRLSRRNAAQIVWRLRSGAQENRVAFDPGPILGAS